MRCEENWVEIPGFPNYEVSTEGRVRNQTTGRMLRPQRAGAGYLQLRLCDEEGCYFFRVNRLVASVFLGSVEEMDVNHIDGDKTNNRVTNLEIISHAENMQHAYRTGLMMPRTKFVRCVETNEVFSSVTSAAEWVGVRQGNMSNHLAGRRSHVNGYHFQEMT